MISSLLFVLFVIVVLVSIANRIRVAYPIVLVLGGMLIGFIPGIPLATMPPDLVLVAFLPPLLYWESVTAPTSEFKNSAWWIFQLAFGLVVVTMVVVALVAHAIVPALTWGVAFVLGAVVSSTDEVAFAPVADRLRVPRHVVATIEGESLVNDATSLILYAVALAAVVTGTFSLPHAIGALALTVVASIFIGIVAGSIAVVAWHFTKDVSLQAVISVAAPFLAYLPAQHFNVSGVLAVVTTGLFVNRFTPVVLSPLARERAGGFWVTIVFLLNAIIFVLVGMQFHSIVASLARFSLGALIWYGVAISLTVIAVRFIWVFAQALLPVTNEPEHAEGKADWSHVTVLAWSGMRGGISLAAALAIPFATAAGPLEDRNLVIFITFCVLLATLVGQGGTLPVLIRWLKVKDDGADEREERLALAMTARAALRRLHQLAHERSIPKEIIEELRVRFRTRWHEFRSLEMRAVEVEKATALYRELERDLIEAQRKAVIALRDQGKIDNTVMRRIQRLLDLETAEIELLGTTGHPDIEEAEE
jgi:monovalent cation/hydrogen antiporter